MSELVKDLGIGGFVGLVVGMAIIYWLRPLNDGAIALVLLISMSFGALLVRSIAWLVRRFREE